MSNVKVSELPVASTLDSADYLVGNIDGVTSRVLVDTANGVAILDAGGKIEASKLPAIAISEIFVVANNTERDALTVQEGDVAKVTDDALTYIYDGSSWVELVANYAVDSVNDKTGAVVLDTDDIGEGVTNKYYASSLFDADLSGKTTDDVSEGATNKYYSSDLTNADIDTRVNKAFVDNLNVDADTLDGNDSTAFAAASHTHIASEVTDFSTAVQTEVDKTYVDGLGIDADTLDGNDSSAFATTIHTHTSSDVTDFDTSVEGLVTKTLIDGLGVDADTLDGNDSTAFAQAIHTHVSSDVTDFDSSVESLVTKALVDGLNVDADTLDGNDSTAFVLQTEVGAVNGVASLGADGKIPSSELPALSISDVYVVADNTERDALTVQTGDIAKVTGTGLTFIYDGTQWVEITASSDVTSVNSQTGNVVLDTDDITEGATNKYYSSSLTNADIDSRVDKAFVDALNVDADTLDGNDSTAFANAVHTHTASDVTDFEDKAAASAVPFAIALG